MINEKIRICIVGCGNISNTRHIPVIKKMKNVEIVGLVSDIQGKLDKTTKKWNVLNQLVVNDPKNDGDKIKKCKWMKDVDAVVIGTPPSQHYPLAKVFLEMNKHVLIEKPMVMNEKECDDLDKIAKKNKLILNVVHNFQYADQMLKLNEVIKSKKYGEVLSVIEIQLTNRNRRLPSWYNDLPLGLFYDEAAHFIYLPQKHFGKIKINNVSKHDYKNEATPISLTIDGVAGKVPLTMMLNFNAPICQWLYIINFRDKIFVYDFFKDILVKINSDNEHLAKDIIKNDLAFTVKYWYSFIRNGFKMVFKKLWYGHDVVISNFINAIRTGKIDQNISCEKGRDTVSVMNEIVKKSK